MTTAEFYTGTGFAVPVNEYVCEWGRLIAEYGLYIWGFDGITVTFGLRLGYRDLYDDDWRPHYATPRLCRVSCSLMYDEARSDSWQPLCAKIKRELERHAG